jgi:hypothetical protein
MTEKKPPKIVKKKVTASSSVTRAPADKVTAKALVTRAPADKEAPFNPIPNPPKKETAAPPMITRQDAIPPTKPAVAVPAEADNPYYHKTLWHGIKEVWQCNTCGVFRESEDAAIVHVVIHVPRLEQNALLDSLMKGLKK